MNLPVDGLPLERQAQEVWRQRLLREVFGSVLPWWVREMTDPAGGHYGGRMHDGRLRNDLPRSGVLGARLLWAFSEAHRRDPGGEWHTSAEHYWRWMRDVLWDKEHGGIYWQVDAQGRSLADHKQAYAQGFAIYAMVAWYRASGCQEALNLAQATLGLLEQHTHDSRYGGYFEGNARDWQPLADTRLSNKEPAAAKSMNTMLHLLEGYTELLRVWRKPRVAARISELIGLFLDRIWQPQLQAFGLFFDADWRCLGREVSYGHDIETAWLLVRAAEVLGDKPLIQQCRTLSGQVARAVLRHGVAEDGSLWAEGRWLGQDGSSNERHEVTCHERHWWPQAEAMVGFWDAWQSHRTPAFALASWRAWCWAEQHLSDPTVGEWRKVLDAQGQLIEKVPRAGPWECPYHHVRACLEMADRLIVSDTGLACT